MSLKSKTLQIAAFESRLHAEMVRLIENLGGEATVVPSMREIPLEKNEEAIRFGAKLKKGEIDLLILMTGVGTRTLIQALATSRSIDDVVADVKKVPILARGPKPVRALAEVGLKPTITIPEPNTWREILKALDDYKNIKGMTVAVQEYGDTNRLFLSELQARGAKVITVPVYRYELPSDTAPMKKTIEQIIDGRIDVVLFTNSTQVEHVFAVARQEGLAGDFRKALTRVVVGSVGPSCSTMLRKYGLPVDVEPPRPMMGALVAEATKAASTLLSPKRAHASSVEFPAIESLSKDDPLYQSLFLKACRKEKTSRTPVWLMRQAGRYMKEYRELRAKVSFLELCKNSDLSAEVTVDAAHRLGVDAAIIFSDLLPLVEPMGFDLSYGKDQGPMISNPFRSESDLKRLKPVAAAESMSFVFDAIRKTRAALKRDIPLIGFAGAPFTMASYIIEGKGSRNFLETKRVMHKEPKAWSGLLNHIANATIDYVNEQVTAGAQAIQLFDSWVGCLSPEDFRAYALPYTRRIVKGITAGVPVIVFGTQTTGLLPLIKETGGDVIGVDWRVELDEAWDILGDVAIQGNLDPVVLLSDPKQIKAQAHRILNQAAGRAGHIFNLGHGVLPETPIENALALVEAVKSYKK